MPARTRKHAKGREKKNELVLKRTFDAPRELVWKAWTEPELVKRWWGPKGFMAPSCEIDLRVGGKYLYCMRSPEGKDYWSTGVFREIVAMKKIVCTDSFADEKGNVVPATHYGMGPEVPREMLVTVTFEDVQGKTKLTLRHAGLPPGAHLKGAEEGWSTSLDKLAESLERISTTEFVADLRQREIVMSRMFDAPRERVFQVMMDPKLIPQWWGPRRYTTTVDKMDVRQGGAWRFVSRGADGTEYGFHGEYREILPPERVVQTFEFERMPGHVVLETATLGERDGKTKLTVRSLFETTEDLEAMAQSGMEEGARETHDRLADLLAGVSAGGTV